MRGYRDDLDLSESAEPSISSKMIPIHPCRSAEEERPLNSPLFSLSYPASSAGIREIYDSRTNAAGYRYCRHDGHASNAGHVNYANSPRRAGDVNCSGRERAVLSNAALAPRYVAEETITKSRPRPASRISLVGIRFFSFHYCFRSRFAWKNHQIFTRPASQTMPND